MRLVTTNFDRVFEEADPSLVPIMPPTLPDLTRPGALNGIIHLHGKVSLDYSAPESPEFVLSSADFGRAYLADGWATTFMRVLMDRYRIVFVGYSADDPPMQYLLEALQPSVASGRLYALQQREASYASGLWRHKGVTAIPFDGFPALWERSRHGRNALEIRTAGAKALCPWQ
ncbi:SIR2 family protein [Muricoccus aerilatus]|uniref:SIR2 family protein n=1 Tax=Muricoccus aerilatus TaxID=452982 RepID=UPI00147071DA|nr:SIR2 family protein [Roseomonas aerilata]